MERRKFIAHCCQTAIGIPVAASLLASCGTMYYAQVTTEADKLVVAKTEFTTLKRGKQASHKFVLLKTPQTSFPICLYHFEGDRYVASLLQCTHRGCELNVGGGIYTCPCHGSEFSTEGKLLEGPADQDLKTFIVKTDHEHIYIYL